MSTELRSGFVLLTYLKQLLVSLFFFLRSNYDLLSAIFLSKMSGRGQQGDLASLPFSE